MIRPEFQIQKVEVERILDVRHRVLRAGLPREMAKFDGDLSPGTVHLAAIIQGNVVGCATLIPNSFENQPAMQLRGMAVDPEFQRLGVGKLLLKEIERAATERAIAVLWGHGRKPALEFYRKLGWVTVGEEYDIPTAGPHCKIVRRFQIS